MNQRIPSLKGRVRGSKFDLEKNSPLRGIATGSGMIAPDNGDDAGLYLHRRKLLANLPFLGGGGGAPSPPPPSTTPAPKKKKKKKKKKAQKKGLGARPPPAPPPPPRLFDPHRIALFNCITGRTANTSTYDSFESLQRTRRVGRWTQARSERFSDALQRRHVEPCASGCARRRRGGPNFVEIAITRCRERDAGMPKTHGMALPTHR